MTIKTTDIEDIIEKMLDAVGVPKKYHAELLENPALADAVYRSPAVREYYIRSKEREAKAVELAYKDELTGLGNTRYLNEILPHDIARAGRSGQPYSLNFMDLDGFKDVNDKLGHPEGSKYLQVIAAVMNNHIRQSDGLFRYGGDEFARTMPDTPLDGAIEATHHLLQVPELQDLFGMHGVSISAGLATYPDILTERQIDGRQINGVDDLLEHADKAMYHAKAMKGNGRSNICVYKDGKLQLV